MSKTLYVRKFSEKLHDELDDQARKEGVSPAFILENAFEDWLKNKKEISKHYLVLYSDDHALLNFVKNVRDLSDGNWFHITCGPRSHIGVVFLINHGWLNAAIPPYREGLKNLEKYTSEVFDYIGKVTAGKPTCFVGFMAEDIAYHRSLQKACEIEKKLNTKKINGITFCPYDMKYLNNFDFTDIFELIKEHDEIFILKRNEIYQLNIDKIHHAKLFL